MPEIDADRLYTIREAAVLLHTSITSIRAWLKHGKISAVRIGPHKVFFRGSDVQAMIRAYKAAS